MFYKYNVYLFIYLPCNDNLLNDSLFIRQSILFDNRMQRV